MKGQPTPEEIFGEDYEGGPTYLRQSNSFTGRDMLKILQAVPRYGGVAIGSYLLK